MPFLKGADTVARTEKAVQDPTQDLQGDITTLQGNVVALQNGTSFNFPGPYSNDSNAGIGGVGVGEAYYGPSGGVVIRQT